MDTLTQLFTGDLSLWGLFFSSLLGATLLPGGSELVLVSVIELHPELIWPALLAGTLGNTLGGMISFGTGWLMPLRMGGSEAAGHPPAVSTPPNRRLEADCLPLVYSSRVMTQQLKHVDVARRYGAPSLLFAWLPFVGDALCVAAGWLRLNPLHAALFMLAGKFMRYALVAFSI